MALSSAIQWEIRQGGSDTNGGGFKSGASGTDWTLQDAAQYSVTDGVTNGTTTITSATANFGTDVVGNVIYVQGGTGSVTAGWYEITARGSATSITVDRSTGLTSGTGVTLKIGGALATPGILHSSTGLGAQLVSGQKAWWKYNVTAYACSTSTSGSAGPFTLASVQFQIEGYDVTRGDRTGNRPTYQWTAAAPGAQTYMLTNSNSRQVFANFTLDGNNTNNVAGFNCAAVRGTVVDCVATNFSGTSGVGYLLNSTVAERCQASNCLTGYDLRAGSASSGAAHCEATGTTGQTGFVLTSSGGGSLFKCLARGMATGYTANGTGGLLVQCAADSCTTSGFNASSGNTATLVSCLATNCTGSGVGFTVNTATAMFNCAYYNNTTNVSGTPAYNVGAISLTADPYTNQAGADFRPNSTAGGGAAIRGAGYGVYGQTDNTDVGAVQHADSGGGTTYVFSGEF